MKPEAAKNDCRYLVHAYVTFVLTPYSLYTNLELCFFKDSSSSGSPIPLYQYSTLFSKDYLVF